MDLFDLAAKITLDSSEYEKGLDNAKGKTNGFASTIGNGLKTAAKVGVAAVAAVGTATTLMAGAIVKGVGATAEYGAHLTAAVARGNVMGTQFHPEKSGEVGLGKRSRKRK